MTTLANVRVSRPRSPLAPVALGLCVVALATLLAGGTAWAYDQYSANRDATNCRACHGDFRAGNYISANDGVAWKVGTTALSLHSGHRDYMLSGTCTVCHTTSKFPVSLSSSSGATGYAPISCLGCHGRTESGAGGAITGAGLRQHHYRAGETVCATSGCHNDANAATFTPVGENVAPPYYFTPDASHPNKPTNPCNSNGTESTYAPPRGLDNDGDGVYDGSDTDCAATPTRRSTWGSVKTTYR